MLALRFSFGPVEPFFTPLFNFFGVFGGRGVLLARR